MSNWLMRLGTEGLSFLSAGPAVKAKTQTQDILLPYDKEAVKEETLALRKATLPLALKFVKRGWERLHHTDDRHWVFAAINAYAATKLAAAAWRKNPALATRILRTAYKIMVMASLQTTQIDPVNTPNGMGMAEMLQKCMICGKVYGRISVPDDDPAAGQVSHGFCPDCANDPKVQKEYGLPGFLGTAIAANWTHDSRF